MNTWKCCWDSRCINTSVVWNWEFRLSLNRLFDKSESDVIDKSERNTADHLTTVDGQFDWSLHRRRSPIDWSISTLDISEVKRFTSTKRTATDDRQCLSLSNETMLNPFGPPFCQPSILLSSKKSQTVPSLEVRENTKAECQSKWNSMKYLRSFGRKPWR